MKNILFIIFIVFSIVGYSQTKRIKILHADNTFVKPEFPGATISMGNVFVEHEGATLRCDKAYIYQEKNLIKAMGNVVVNQGDTIFQYSKYTDYDGNTKIATSWGKVFLKDELMEYMASLPEGHTSAYCSYVKPAKSFDRSVAAIMAMSERIEVPTKTVQDWSQFHKDIKGRIDFKGLCDNYPIYKEKAGYIRSEKKVA